MSRVMPESELDSVGKARSTMGDGRAFDYNYLPQNTLNTQR